MPQPSVDPASQPDDNRVTEVLAISIAVMALSGFCVAVRLLTRLFVVRTPLVNGDWFIIASLLFAWCESVDICVQTHYGLGTHIWNLPKGTDLTKVPMLFYIGENVYYPSLALTKLSILVLYLKLNPDRGFRIFTYFMAAFVTLFHFATTIANIFQCWPIEKVWYGDAVEGKCFKPTDLFYANAAVDLFQDLVIYVMPAKMLWKLNLPAKQRIGLLFVFLVGGFVVITGGIRLKSLYNASISDDPFYDNVDSANWSSIHLNIGVVCASLVHFKPLLARYFPSILGTAGRSTARSGGSDFQTIGGSYVKTGPNKDIMTLTEFNVEENQSQTNILDYDHREARSTTIGANGRHRQF